jgi:WD40 repeat protein
MKAIGFIILFWVGCLLSSPITASLDNPTPITTENVVQLEELAILGRGGLSSMDISPDGEMLAIGTTAGVWIYDMNDLTREPIYFNHGFGFVTNVTFDESGHFLNVLSTENEVGGYYESIWYFEENFVKPIRVELDIEYGQYVDFVGNGYVLDTHGVLWDWETKTPIDIDLSVQDTYQPNNDMVIMSPDGSFIAVGLYAGREQRTLAINFFDTQTKEYFASMGIEEDLEAGKWMFTDMAFAMNGEYLIAIVWEYHFYRIQKVKIWSMKDLMETRTISYQDGITIWENETGNLLYLDIQNDFLTIRSVGRGTDILRLPDGELLQQIPTGWVDIDPLTNDIITLETEYFNEFDVVNVTQNRVLGTLHEFGSSMQSFILNADKTQFITTKRRTFSRDMVDDKYIETYITHIEWWDIRTRQVIDTAYFYDVDYSYNEIIRFMPDGRPLVVAINTDSITEFVELWDLSSQQKLYQFEFAYSSEIQVSTDGTMMFVFDRVANTIALYDISYPEAPFVKATISSEYRRIGEIQFSPDNLYLVFIEVGKELGNDSLQFLNIDQRQEVARITNLRVAHINLIQWSQDGQFMAICQYQPLLDKNYQFSFWRMDDILNGENPQPFMTLPVHFCHEKIFQSTLDLSSQGVFLIPDNWGGNIQQWSLDGQFVQEFLTENNSALRYPVLHPDGAILWGVNPYGQVTAWRLSDATELVTFIMAPWRINQIEFVQDNSLMLVVVSDGTIRLWGIPAEE